MSATLLIMSSHFNHSINVNKKNLIDEGTCKNCKYQGNCPYLDGSCSRAYRLNFYSPSKNKKCIDRFVLKWYIRNRKRGNDYE